MRRAGWSFPPGIASAWPERGDARLVVTIDRDQCLLIYPLPEWEEIERKLMRLPTLNEHARRLQRLMVGYATDVELDGHGRLLLPPTLRGFAHLERNAMLIGQGNRFELWDEAALGRAPRAVAERRGIADVAAGGTGFPLAVTGAPNGVPLEEPRGGEHAPVLRNAAIESLAIRADGCYVDATFGRGGHAGEILGRLGDEGKLVAFDRDPEAAAAAAVLFPRGHPRALRARRASPSCCSTSRRTSADGVLFDLGVSSPQLDEARRGFSFMRDGPLDMRMDPDAGVERGRFPGRAPTSARSRP